MRVYIYKVECSYMYEDLYLYCVSKKRRNRYEYSYIYEDLHLYCIRAVGPHHILDATEP
jgi:hypothetical protein